MLQGVTLVESGALRDKNLRSADGRTRRLWLPSLLWLVFAAGLLTEVLSPHLKIENDAFVMPPSLVDGSKPINPAEIVARAKRMQLLSMLLTVEGAVSLGLYYWPFLVGRRSA
jgi:hypothetical protein